MMEEALVVLENILWASEGEAASPYMLPEDLPVDRLPVAFRTSLQVSTEISVSIQSRITVSWGQESKKLNVTRAIMTLMKKNRLYALEPECMISEPQVK